MVSYTPDPRLTSFPSFEKYDSGKAYPGWERIASRRKEKKQAGSCLGRGDSEELAEGLAVVVEEPLVGTGEVVTKKGT